MKNVWACAVLLAISDEALKGFTMLLCAAAASIGLLAAWLTPDPHVGALRGAFCHGLGVVVVWANAGPAGEGLRREARAACVPEIGRTVLLVWAVLGLVTVLGPALVLGLLGGDVAELAGLLVGIALAGALLGSFSRQELPAAFRCVLAALLYCPLAGLFFLRAPDDPGSVTSLAWESAALSGLLLVLRWRWQSREASEAAGRSRGPAGRDGLTGWLAGFSLQPTLAHLRSGDPKSSMRALLGAPFAPLGFLQRCIYWPLIASLPMFDGWVQQFLGTAKDRFVMEPLQLSVMLVWLLFSMRVRTLFAGSAMFIPLPKKVEELTELALLPAWNDARTARHLLLRSVLKPQLVCLLIVWLTAALIAGIAGIGSAAFPVMFFAFAGIAVALVASSLRVLAGQPLTFHAVASYAPCFVAWFFTEFAMTVAFEGHSQASASDAWTLTAAILAWLVSLVSTGLLARDAWHRFTERPHPFLAT